MGTALTSHQRLMNQSILDGMIEDTPMPVFGAVVKESPAVAVVKDPLDELFA